MECARGNATAASSPFLRSSSIGPEIQRPQRAASPRIGFRLPPPGHNSRRTFGHITLWPRCTAARRTGRPCGGSAADTDLFVHHKTVIALCASRAARKETWYRPLLQWLAGDEIVGKARSAPDAVIFLPVTARILINAAKRYPGSNLVVLRRSQVLQNRCSLESIKLPGCHRATPLRLFNPNDSWCDGSLRQRRLNAGSSVR